MDKIILGLLMLRKLTIYELKNIVNANFTSMCSSSTGSIQAALKKLLGENMITFEECIENGVHKKMYSLTDVGKDYFLSWVQCSMSAGKTKDMELSKLFFMGYVPAENRVPLIESYIEDLRVEKIKLEAIQQQDVETAKLRQIAYMTENEELLHRFRQATGYANLETGIDEVADFERFTLQLGIDRINFEIEWFERLKAKLLG